MNIFSNCIFVCLKDHKWSIIVWIIIISFGIFFIIFKVYMPKTWHKLKVFLHVKAFKLWKWTVLVFYKHFFFLPNVHHSFWKLERISTLMNRKNIYIIIIMNWWKSFLLPIWAHLVQKCFWPWKLWILKMCL